MPASARAALNCMAHGSSTQVNLRYTPASACAARPRLSTCVLPQRLDPCVQQRPRSCPAGVTTHLETLLAPCILTVLFASP